MPKDKIHKGITKVQGYSVDLEIDHQGSRFRVEVEEGHVIEASSLEDLKYKIDGWLKREEAKERKKRKKIDIPILRFTDDSEEIRQATEGGSKRRRVVFPRARGETPWTLLEGKITGIHSGTNNPIVKIGSGRAGQDGYDYSKYLKPMTDEEKEEFLRLHAAKLASEKAFTEFEARFSISRLVEYMEKKGAI
jgi:hypothetical protein